MCAAKVLALLGLVFVLLDNISSTEEGVIEDGCTSDADCKKLNSVCNVSTSVCVCLPGYQDQGQQCSQCQNKHECIALNYSADVRCYKFVCSCKDGTNNCFPKCPDLTAPANGSVTYDPDTTAGSTATFSCDSGYDSPSNPTRTCQMDGSWDDDTIPICTDIDECLANTDLCDDNANCSNTEGSYTCQCNDGYEGNGTTCTDIDECLENTDLCDDNANCSNTEGSYTCQCNDGYEGNGTTCTDIDECLANTDLCDDNANCSNTEGSYTCQCNDGYEGNGTTCTDIDECLENTDLCDDNANCSNIEGSYTCQCNDGYEGNGTTCTDIDECLTNTELCDDNANCLNTEGSYTCQCNVGYEGNGTTCTEKISLALNKPVIQSSTYAWYVAGFAVDGIWETSSYSHTNVYVEEFAWWEVDLQTLVVVSGLKILNRAESVNIASRLHDVTVTVGNSTAPSEVCAEYVGPGSMGELVELTCSPPITGRYVRISKPNTPGIDDNLALCEVGIY